MKPVEKVFLLTLLAVIPHLLVAQKIESTANKIRWSILSGWSSGDRLGVTATNCSGSPYTEGISTSVLKIDGKSIISSIQINKTDYGVVRLSEDLATQWLTPVDGHPISTGIFHGDILVITTPKITNVKGISNNYTGYLIDKKTGKINAQKNFYVSNDDYYQQHVFLISGDGSYFKMVVRTSTLNTKLHFGLAFSQSKSAEEFFDSSDFEVYDYDNNLNLKSVIKPVLEKGDFIGATINKNGDVFLLTDYGQGVINVARYENNKVTPAKVLQVQVSMGDKEIDNLQNHFVFTSKDDPAVLFYAIMYDNDQKYKELVVAKLNFNNSSVLKNTQELDRQYFKDLVKSFVPFNKKFDVVNLGDADKFQINNMLENDGKLILSMSSYTEIRANPTMGTSGSSTARDLIINIYGDKTDLLHQQIIPRNYYSGSIVYFNGGAGLHCSNNILYIATNNNRGSLLAKIDLKTGNVSDLDFIKKKDIKNSYGIDPYATAWFDDKYIISYIQIKNAWFDEGSKDAHLQLIDY